MIVFLLSAALVISVINGARWKVACMATMLYIGNKNYTLPSDVEQEACIREAWMRFFRGDF